MATGKVVVKLLKPDGAGHMQRIFNHYIGTDPKYKEEGGDQHQTNPPSTDSSSSSSSSSISPPASSYTTPASLDYLEFMNLLIDLVGTEAAGIDAKGLYEVSTLFLCEKKKLRYRAKRFFECVLRVFLMDIFTITLFINLDTVYVSG